MAWIIVGDGPEIVSQFVSHRAFDTTQSIVSETVGEALLFWNQLWEEQANVFEGKVGNRDELTLQLKTRSVQGAKGPKTNNS